MIVPTLDSGATIDSKNTQGFTPLHYAAWEGNQDIAVSLLRKGASANAADNKGKTPMHYAAHKDRVNVMYDLLRYGGDPELVSSNRQRSSIEMSDSKSATHSLLLNFKSRRQHRQRKLFALAIARDRLVNQEIETNFRKRNKEDQFIFQMLQLMRTNNLFITIASYAFPVIDFALD